MKRRLSRRPFLAAGSAAGLAAPALVSAQGPRVRRPQRLDAVLQRQLEAHDAAVSKRRHNALFRDIAG